MATDNNDIFPEDITKMLEKMDKTIEENSSNLNADVQITVHTNSDNTDIDNSFINLNKQIDDTLDSLDRRVDQHKGAFDIWKTFGVELDTESFGSDDANKDRTDKDAVYDQLALLAKVLNKNPKLIGTLTSINGKNLKLILGDSNERAEYLNRANKLAYLEHGYIINKKEYDNNTDTIGFTGKNHNIITAPKSKNQNELDETLFHEYGHRILNKILDELGISHNVKGETVTQFINRLKIKNSSLTAVDVQEKARKDFLNAKIDGSTYIDMFHNPEKYINKPNKKIDTIIDLFTVINNDPLLLNKGSKKEYVNDFQEVFARSFANYVAGMANFYTDKRVNIEKNNYNTVNTKLYNSTMDQNFVKFLSLLNGETLIGKESDESLNFDTAYHIFTGRNFKGKNSTEITKRLLNILNLKGGDHFNLTYSRTELFKGLKQILTDNNIELSKYNFSPTNIYKILSSVGYKSGYIIEDENGNQQKTPVKNIVHEILGAKTNQDIENLEKLSKLGKLIEDIKDIGDKISGKTINNIKDVYNILSEIGYNNLSKEEIEILRNSYDKLPTHVKTNLRGYKTSLDAAMSKIPTSDIENKNENYYEEKIKQDVTSFNSFADAIKSLSDTFKNNFESAIESSASYFKKAFETAIVSYGDVLARVGVNKTNPFTDNTFTGGYNHSIDKNESRIGTPFVTKDGRKLYSQKAINEYNQAQLRDSGTFVTDISVVPEVLQKSQPLLLTYDPSATFAYTQENRESNFQNLLNTVTPEPENHWKAPNSHERRKQRRAEERRRIENENKNIAEVLGMVNSIEETPSTLIYNREPDKTTTDIVKDIVKDTSYDDLIKHSGYETIIADDYVKPNLSPKKLREQNKKIRSTSFTLYSDARQQDILKSFDDEMKNELEVRKQQLPILTNKYTPLLEFPPDLTDTLPEFPPEVKDSIKATGDFIDNLASTMETIDTSNIEKLVKYQRGGNVAIKHVSESFGINGQTFGNAEDESYSELGIRFKSVIDDFIKDPTTKKYLDMDEILAEGLGSGANIDDASFIKQFDRYNNSMMNEMLETQIAQLEKDMYGVMTDDQKESFENSIEEWRQIVDVRNKLVELVENDPSSVQSLVNLDKEIRESLQSGQYFNKPTQNLQSLITTLQNGGGGNGGGNSGIGGIGGFDGISGIGGISGGGNGGGNGGNPPFLFNDYTKSSRGTWMNGKQGFNAGGKTGLHTDTSNLITWSVDPKTNQGSWKINVENDAMFKDYKQMMDLNEAATHMQKHMEDFWRFQFSNKTNPELAPLEYLNAKYAERADYLKQRMENTSTGFASTIYKIGGKEHTYNELLGSDTVLTQKMAKMNQLVEQIKHANDIDAEGKSTNPLTTYMWLRELSEIEKDIKKRTANVIKEQQTIYKELSDIVKEGEKIADDGIKQADKMLAGDSTYKSIFGKYKIPELSRSGKFKLTSDEYQKVLGIEDMIKTKKELLQNDSLDKAGRETIRNEIKNLNKQLDDYTTGQIADRAKAVSGIEDDYKKNVIPALNKFNKVFGNVFNTNADIDYENIREGGMTKMQELSKFINLDKIFNVDNIKKYAAELSKNIGTMFDSGIKMFQSALSKITSIIGSVVKDITILITGAFATVTAAVTGFVAGFTAMGKSIVSATDVYRKQTIALGGVYQSPTKTNRMINTVYDVTRSMPINYTQAVQTLSEMSAIPALQTILKSNDTQKSDQLLTKMFKVITAMTTMRPDQKSSDAIFSLRNAFAGDLRSLQRRFDLPTANIMNVKGTMGLAGVKTDPMAMLDSLENYFDSFLDVGTINKISDTISIIIEKIKGAIDLFKANIGNAGFYELVAEDFRKLRDVVVNFVTSADGKKLAKRISDVFSNVYDSVKSIAVKFKDIISGIFNVNLNSLPELFMKGLEFFAKSVNYIDKLLNVKDVTQYVKDLINIVVDSKDIVLGYVDTIKNKLIDMTKPILKVATVITDVVSDIINVLKKTGLSDKGIFYLWLFGPSNVLNMIIGGLGLIKSSIGLIVTTVGTLINSGPIILKTLGLLKTAVLPFIAKAWAIATVIDLIVSNFENIKVAVVDLFDSIKILLDPLMTIQNTLISTAIDGLELIGKTINSIFDFNNFSKFVSSASNIIVDIFNMTISKIPGLPWVLGIEKDANTLYQDSYEDLQYHWNNSQFIPDDLKTSSIQFMQNVKAIPEVIKDGFKPWGRIVNGDFSDFKNAHQKNMEKYNPEGKEWTSGHVLPATINLIPNTLDALNKFPSQMKDFLGFFISNSESDSKILNGSNTLLSGIKTNLEYIKVSMQKNNVNNGMQIGHMLNAATVSAGGFVPSYIDFAGMKDARTNPFKAILDEIDNTEVKSYSAPYESPMWTNRLTSMYMDVAKLQFQRNNIWSRNSKSSNLEKVFGTKYGNFGAQGLEELNLKKLENLKNIVQIVNEVGKVKLDAKDQEDFDKNFAEKFALAKQKTDEIDDMIRDNIEASVMLIQDTLGHTKLDYLKNNVMHYVMAEQSKFNSKLEQDINDTVRLQYSVYFATNDEFDRILGELRRSYHSIDDMYSAIANGNADFKDMSELGKQIAMEVAKRYEAERDYLWNLERQRAYIEVTNKNINKMGLAELSGNWSNLMNSRYKKVRDAAGNQYMDIMKENLEQDTMGSMVRKVRDIAINSFTDMKNAVINAVQEIVKSTQQTIKNGLDKFIAEGGTVKPVFKDLYEMIKKNFFGIYTNEVANELTKFIYGSSLENDKQEDPLLLLDDDVKSFHKDILDKMNDAILANKQALNDTFKEWLKDNPSLKPETNVVQDANTGLYRGSAYIVEKQGSNLAPLDSKYADFNTISNGVATRRATDIGKDHNKYDDFIKEASNLYGIETSLIKAVINTESSFNMLKANNVGAVGLMQVRSGAAHDVNEKFGTHYDRNNPRDNIMLGTAYLRMQMDKFKNTNLALAAYNSGAQNVIDAKGIPSRKETQNYIPTVNMFKEVFAEREKSNEESQQITSLDSNVSDIRNDIKQIVTGTSANVSRTGYSEINAPTINNIISGTSEGFNLDGLFGGINIPSGIADLGNHTGFGVIGKAIKSSALDILFGKAGSKSNSSKLLNLVFNKDKGYFDSATLTSSGSNILNTAINAAGAGIGGVGGVFDVAQMMNLAGANLQKPETPLKGIWGQLFGTVENVESKFGGASVGSFLGNMMSGKGIWDSFASANTMGASTFESLKGANSFTKVATGLTSTLLGKTAGAKVAAKLTGTKILGTSLGTALPVVGAVATVLSKKGWFGGAKDRTAEGRARGAEFNTLRDSLIANRNTLARNYYMANDDTLNALRDYQFGEVAMWTSRRGHKWNGTKRRIMNTDATAFVNSMQGYWDLLQQADEENRATQRSLNKLQNTNNMEYLRQTGAYEEKRRNSIQEELSKYRNEVNRYAGHDTGFTQTLFDGQSYTMTQLNDKIQDLINELGDSKDAIEQNTEARRQEQLATESAKLDYQTALYGDLDPTIASKNNLQKLQNEWNSIITETPIIQEYERITGSRWDGTRSIETIKEVIGTVQSVGYTPETKEYWDYMTRLTQANRELKNVQKQQSIDLSTNWISDLRGIAKENGTYDNSQIKRLSNLYGKREKLKIGIQNAVDNMDSALAEKLYDESQAITEEIEHYKSSTSFSNAISSARDSMNNVFNNVTVKPIDSLMDNVNSMMNVIQHSEQWIKDAGYSGYDELDSSVLLPLFQSSFGNVNEMSSIFTEGVKNGIFDTTQINPFKEYSNGLMNNLDTFKTNYRNLVDSGATKKEITDLILAYQNTILQNIGGMNSEYEKMFKAYQQDITASSILSSMSGFEDYTVANDALKEFNDTLGAGAMEKLIGYGGEFDSESLGRFMNVSGLNEDSDPYEMYHEWEKKHIMQRIENSEEGSEEWYAAELELWNLMADNAKYLKEKAEKTTATIEEMLNKIEETARTRVAEEGKSAKGDIIFFDLGSSREGAQFINKMLDGIDANTPESQKLMKTLKQKLMGMRR